MRNKSFWYIFIAVAIYLVLISFPTYLFTSDLYVLYGVELGLRAAYLIFIILFSIFTHLAKTYNGKTKLSNFFLLLPLFFVAFFNLFYLAVVTRSNIPNPLDAVFNNDGNNTLIILKFVCLLIMAVEEELLFRYILLRNLKIGHKIVRILVTSAIFALCYFFKMLYDGRGVIVPINLLSIIIIFGIGIILGFLYEYTNNIFVPIAFSIIYAICNEMIYEITFEVATTKYYLTVLFFILGTAAYLSIFYFLMLKKENR